MTIIPWSGHGTRSDAVGNLRHSLKMPTYEFLLHTTGIRLDLGNDGPPAIGFHTSRRIRAKNSQEACETIMALMEKDPDLADILRSGHEAGLRPATEVEDTCLIPWWKSILPWLKPGLAFYTDDPDDGSIEAVEDVG